MSPRRTKAKDLRRKTARRPERRTIVIFCEGEASEPDYLNGLKKLPCVRENTAISLEIDPRRGVPLTLVERAVDRMADDEVDECWCVFDVEWPQHHPNLGKAVELANAHGVRLAISNPCFEFWLILHFENHTGFLTTKEAESRSRKLDRRAGKRIDPQQYMERRIVAAQRASALCERHENDQTAFPENNPSSTIHELLATVSALR